MSHHLPTLLTLLMTILTHKEYWKNTKSPPPHQGNHCVSSFSIFLDFFAKKTLKVTYAYACMHI